MEQMTMENTGKDAQVATKLADRTYLHSANAREGQYCAVCRVPVEPRYTVCWQCHSTRQGTEDEGTLHPASRTGFIVYAALDDGDRTFAELTDYRKGYRYAAAWWTLTALLAQAFRDDLPGLEKAAGPVHTVTNVPLDDDESRDYLGNAVRDALSAVGRKKLHRRDILRPVASSAGRAHGTEIAGTVRNTATVPEGAHVLLVTDMWHTGRRTQATADALFRAGAGQVSVLAVARLLDPSFAPAKDLIGELPEVAGPSPEHPVVWSDAPAAGTGEAATTRTPAQRRRIPGSTVTGTSAAERLPGDSLKAAGFGAGALHKGVIAEQRTAGVLSVFLNNAHARVLHSVRVGELHSSEDEKRDIDHVLFTTAGVFVVNTKFRGCGLDGVPADEVESWVRKMTRDAHDIDDVVSTVLAGSPVDLDTVHHPVIAVWCDREFVVETGQRNGVTLVQGENLADHIRSLPDVITPETCTAMFEILRLRTDHLRTGDHRRTEQPGDRKPQEGNATP